jgi:predicted PurR-regulated permease PerM
MKVRMDEKQRAIAKTAVWIFTICMLIGIAFWRWTALVGVLKKILGVLAPIIIGLVLAYLLNPLMCWIEKYTGKLIERKKPHPTIKRVIAVTLTFVILVAAIAGLVMAIVPELVSSIKNLIVNLPEYLTSVGKWMERNIAGLEQEHPQLYATLMSFWNNAQDNVSSFAEQLAPKLDSIASGGADFITQITTGAVSIVSSVLDFLLGLIMSIYLLYNKEHYQAQARKVLYALFPQKKTHTFLHVGAHVSYTFMHFLSGKTLDSLIIGLLCFIGLTILRMPYITLISITIGVTNIIPFFGPIIGAVPTGLLVLLTEPKKVIPFVIFILLLQQFDGNILGPKILGDSLGMPMFWTLFAITVGGGLFGFIGMVAFIPLFAALYAFLSDFFTERLAKKGLPADTESYMTDKIHFAEKPAPSADEAVPDLPEAEAEEETVPPTAPAEEPPADA